MLLHITPFMETGTVINFLQHAIKTICMDGYFQLNESCDDRY